MSLSRWNANISSPAVSLAKEFSKHNRVFFIEHPYTFKDVLTGSDQPREKQPNHFAHGPNLTIIKPAAVVPVNFLPAGRLYNWFDKFNQAILNRTLSKTIAEHHIDRYIFINFFDPYYLRNIKHTVKPLRYIYQCMDDISQVSYTRRHGVRLENEVVSRADVVLCTSGELVRLKSPFSKRVFLHPNAADFKLFHSAYKTPLPTPSDAEFAGRKVIGFTGSIEYRTDFELLHKIAETHADKIVAMVGPIAGTEHIEAGLMRLSNVVWLGARRLDELPAYLRRFDCCIIPYKKNVLTASIYPLKINEYLAAAKPVITTDFSADIKSFAEVAYVARSHDDFLKLIDVAINDNDVNKQAARVLTAARNTWEKRVEEFWNLIT